MKKKTVLVIGMLLTAFFVLVFVGSGFGKCSNVRLGEYTLSEDGSILTMNVQMMGSMGYTRDYAARQVGDKKYMTFYSAFGGLNGNIGAKSTFETEIDSRCTEIYFYDTTGEYRLVLEKNKTINEWVRPIK